MYQTKWFVCLLSSCLFLMAGCTQPQGEVTVAADPVETAQPKILDIVDFEEFTGQTEAILSVQIRSRVTGYLLQKNFQDGDEVREGDVLYEIDDRVYKAALTAAEARVVQSKAHRTRLELDFHRAINLFQRGTIGRQEYDLISSNYSEALGMLNASKALLETARLNYDYTRIRSPMDGQLSRSLIDPGNMVVQNKTLLNDIVMGDKLYINFDINEEGMQRVRGLIDQGQVESENGKEVPVEVGTSVDADHYQDATIRLLDLVKVEQELRAAMANKKFPFEVRSITYKDKKDAEKDLNVIGEQIRAEKESMPKEFPYKGLVNFTENKLDAATGTLRVRGIIDNPRPWILSPGLFVRVHLPIGEPHPAVLIRDEAIGSNQGRSFVYVIDRDNEVEYRTVVLGALHEGLREITSGLKPGEWIIDDADVISRVRPGSRVQPSNAPGKNESTKSPVKTASR